ncbi:DMT family transporter [Dasania marina]|uniref:DMT family transporter n=1 Tax=Dasania marina TaxID=471499 RepID=UPI0030D90C35|tara:strand:+ start:73217 stop:74101 length:885 start_codon:yes stop_codon:yes gene_type:complete
MIQRTVLLPAKLGSGYGIYFAGLAIVANVAFDTVIKYVLAYLPVLEVNFLRWFIGAVILLPLAYRYDWWRGFSLTGIHGIRMLLNLIGAGSFFFTLSQLSLSLTVAIFFLEPLFSILFARLLFQERNPMRRYVAVVAGFIGVVLMLDINTDIIATEAEPIAWLPVLLGLFGAASWGLMNVLTRHYGRDISSGALMFWLAVLTAIGLAPLALMVWQAPSLPSIALITLAAVFGSLYNFSWAQAFKTVAVTTLAGVFNLYLPLAALAGWLFFAELMSLQMMTGAVMVVMAMVVACY